MPIVSPFTEASCYPARELREIGGVTMAEVHGSPAEEYEAARKHVALFDRSDRGLLEVAGADRQTWLHGLVTNAVATLAENTGNYAFAANAAGRVLFDLNVLCLPGRLWLDIDRRALGVAAAHFDRHLVNEEVRIGDIGGRLGRLGCSGPQVGQIAERLGAPGLARLPALSCAPIAEETLLVRHDFAGWPGFELIVPRGRAAEWWDRLVACGASPAGHATLDLLRIEAGIPWYGSDLDDRVLPPETGQAERGISYQKSCYLGQEVISRARSRDGLSSRLVKLRAAGAKGLGAALVLRRDGVEIGRITSWARHPSEPHWAGLGYLRTDVTGFAGITVGDRSRPVTICSA